MTQPFGADGCDAGIRLGERLSEHVVAEPITPKLEMAVVGTPEYFARHGKPKTPTDLMEHNCIQDRHSSSGATYAWEFTLPSNGHDFSIEPKGNFITNDDEGMLRAALSGFGLIQHIDLVVRKHVDDGTLVRVLSSWCPPFPGFFLYVPSRQMPYKVRALRDFLVEKRDALTRSGGARRVRSSRGRPR